MQEMEGSASGEEKGCEDAGRQGAYLLGRLASVSASLRDEDFWAGPGPADNGPGPIPGKLCLKAA